MAQLSGPRPPSRRIAPSATRTWIECTFPLDLTVQSLRTILRTPARS
jgi:hypothetical protein